jgi:hypothetical protein
MATNPHCRWNAKIRAETQGKENRNKESHEEGRRGEMKEITPEESRTRRVKTYLQDLLEAARSAHEETAVLHHTSYSLTELDTLKLHTNLIRAQAERMTSLINDLIANIEKGEIVMEDFSPK